MSDDLKSECSSSSSLITLFLLLPVLAMTHQNFLYLVLVPESSSRPSKCFHARDESKRVDQRDQLFSSNRGCAESSRSQTGLNETDEPVVVVVVVLSLLIFTERGG